MKLRKRSRRGNRYESLSEGYKALKSPLSAAYASAAEHYHEADPPDVPAQPEVKKSEQ